MSGEIILYQTEDGATQVSLREIDGTVWLSQAQLAELFQATKQSISLHVINILEEGELLESATVKENLTVQTEGSRQVSRSIKLYNLDMILAIGFRVHSARGTQFRRWATAALSEYLVKGFVMDDARLKEPGGDTYFDELLARIREIRASEKRFYQKVRDLFAQTSTDYDGTSDTASTFFKTIQNKMLFAVTGQTAAELIVGRANSAAPNMNLTTWKGSRVRKGDITISKNYLNEIEANELNRLTTMFLDFAEDRAARRKQTLMTEWIAQTDRFLTFNERSVLSHKGSISHEAMESQVSIQYEEFEKTRRAAERVIADREAEDETLKVIEAVSKKLKPKGKNDAS